MGKFKRFRVWCWVRLAKAGGGVSRWAQRRGAKACGCVDCRPIWDLEFRRKLVEGVISSALREMGVVEPAKAADRRPS